MQLSLWLSDGFPWEQMSPKINGKAETGVLTRVVPTLFALYIDPLQQMPLRKETLGITAAMIPKSSSSPDDLWLM